METRTIVIGGYGLAFRPRTAGPWGCHPCFFCHERPESGSRIWSDCYGDIACEPCSRKLMRPLWVARLTARDETGAVLAR